MVLGLLISFPVPFYLCMYTSYRDRTRLVYTLGSTYAPEGDFQKADDLIREARPVVHAAKPSFAVHCIYLHEVFTNLVLRLMNLNKNSVLW